MIRVPYFLRAAAGLTAAATLIAARPADRPIFTGDVTAVSILSSSQKAELVIDVQGVVEVSDFVLAPTSSLPPRVVVDLVGARLTAPIMQYDGVNRGGIRNVRYSQFRPDVVRVVVELDAARDYQVQKETAAVRVGFQTSETFAAWSSDAARGESHASFAASSPPASVAAAPRAPAVSPVVTPVVASAPSAAFVTPVRLFQGTTQPRITVTFDQATVPEVVATFAGFSGRSIVVGTLPNAELISAEIRDQPWDLALNAILDAHGLAVTELPGGILRVTTRAAIVAADSSEPVQTKIYPINYARVTALQPSVQGIMSPRGKAVADTVTNSMIVTELRSRIGQIDTFLLSLDQRTPQVAIQSRIVFVDRTEIEDLGLRYDLSSANQFYTDLIPTNARNTTTTSTANPIVNLGGNSVAAVANATQTLSGGNPALKLVYATVVGNFSLTSFLEALQSVSLADDQAEPAVTVADNRPADIFSGEETPVRQIDAGSVGTGGTPPRAVTTFKQTGIQLQVTPHVVAGTREVLMTLHAERSQVTASALSETGSVFSRQSANTQLLVHDGETAVIGGLSVTEITVSKSGIPFLVDLPVIGPLFGFRNNQEVRRDLLILVTPHIVDDLSTVGTGGQNR